MAEDAQRKYEIAQVILAVWDSRNGDYINGVNDSYVAMSYGFAVHEVEWVRHEFFEVAREKAKSLKAQRADFAKHIALTREIFPSLVNAWTHLERLARLSPRIVSGLAEISIEVENLHKSAAAGEVLDFSENKHSLAKFARYLNRHRQEIKMAIVSFQKLQECMQQLGLDVAITPTNIDKDDFTTEVPDDILPALSASAQNIYRDDIDFDP